MALTKVSRGLLNTSIVDNGNATAITIDSSENVAFTGEITANGGIALGDGDVATFGDSDDLSIQHLGGNTYLTNTTGSLILRSDSFRVLNTANSEQILHGDANGAVTAYYDNAVKLATTATGIDVTGTATMDGLTVDGSTTGSVAILVENTLASGDADSDINLKTASSGGELRINFDHPSATSPSFIQGSDQLIFAPNGTVAMSLENNGAATFSGDGNTTFKANNSGQGPILTLENTATSITTNDVIGQVDFYANDASTGGTGQKATIQALAENTSGTSVGLIFGTSPFPNTTATERLRINASGYLKAKANGGNSYGGTYHELINNNNVSGDRCLVLGNNGGTATNNTASKTLTIADSAADRLFIFGNGDIVNQNNSYGSISDLKLKENITDATPKLAGINQVRVVNYNLISNPDVKQLGVVAQELEQIFPGMVDETPDSTFYEETVLDADGNPVVDADGNNVTERKEKLTGESTKSVKYSVFVPMLIKAMQEQQAIIEALTARLEALEGA